MSRWQIFVLFTFGYNCGVAVGRSTWFPTWVTWAVAWISLLGFVVYVVWPETD